MKQKLRDNTHIIIFSGAGLLWCLFLWWFSPKFLIACFIAYMVLKLYILWKHGEFVVTRIQCDYARNRCTLFSRFCRLEDVPLNAIEARLRRALIPEGLPVPEYLEHEVFYIVPEENMTIHSLLQKSLTTLYIYRDSKDYPKGIVFSLHPLKPKRNIALIIQEKDYIKFLEELKCQKSQNLSQQYC